MKTLGIIIFVVLALLTLPVTVFLAVLYSPKADVYTILKEYLDEDKNALFVYVFCITDFLLTIIFWMFILNIIF